MPVNRVNGPMDDQGGVRERLALHALLPLRLFLGFTFLYAGIDKFTSWGPFTSSMDVSVMESMVEFSRDRAAAPWIAELAVDHPGLLITGAAVAEIVIGAAVLSGFLTRPAALAGALLMFSMWLTVGWGTSPYYFGQDLPYAVGFLTLALAGAGTFSLGAALRERARP
ncbi:MULTISPECIES: DoxX family protein [Streptomyces]|uniref:DoxX family protein n=1 Tax=Streptomyces TaxID=1883 RepID=UPI001D131EEB|nr:MULTISPECIES: DoxX family protein [Streptomyces]